MTTAGGGGGFIEGDDYVALRLNLDIPTESVTGVQTITKAVENYSVAMEAAIRAEADMASYAEKMAESVQKAAEAQDNMTEQLKTYLQLSGKITPQGSGVSSGVPQGPHQQPWEPGVAGTGASPVPPGARMPSPSDVVYQLGDRAGGTHQSAASYLNMQHQRGNVPDTISISPESIQSLATQIADRERAVTKQDQHTKHSNAPQRPHHPPSNRDPSPTDPFDQFQERIHTAGGLAGQVMNEVGSGTPGSMGQLALQGLNWARKKLEDRAAATEAATAASEGTGAAEGAAKAAGMGGLAKMLGAGGAAATAALAAFALYQEGGQMIQGWRNIASPQGGGAGEGFELSLKQRMLSMDPNITTGQSREIYQAMLSHGYADASGGGPQSEQIKNYLTTNIKQYNMDVSESMQLLKLSAHTTKVSVGDLNEALYTLQQMSKGSAIGQQEMQRNFIQRWSQLEAQGVPEAQGLRSALQAGGVWRNDPTLEGSFAQTNFTELMSGQMGLFGGPGGTPVQFPGALLPQDYSRYAQSIGKGNEMELEVLKQKALQAKQIARDTSGGKDPTNPNWQRATKLFYDTIQPLLAPGSPFTDLNQASRMYNVLAWSIDGKGKPTSNDPKEIVHQANISTLRPELEVQTIRHPPKEIAIPGIGAIPIGPGGQEHVSKREQKIIDVMGKENLQVVNPDGSVWDLDTGNADQAAGLAAGKYKLRRKGDEGKGMNLVDFPMNINKDFSTDDPTNPAGMGSSDKSDDNKDGGKVTGTLTIKIDRNGNVSAPSSVPLTANDDASNKGSGDAQRNNPPIGNQILDYLTGGLL